MEKRWHFKRWSERRKEKGDGNRGLTAEEKGWHFKRWSEGRKEKSDSNRRKRLWRRDGVLADKKIKENLMEERRGDDNRGQGIRDGIMSEI